MDRAREGGRRVALSTLALTVHGPAGALDLVVPPEASADDLSREYAVKAGLQFAPVLHTRLGRPLEPALSLTELGIRSGDVLAAGGAVRRHSGAAAAESRTGTAGGGPAAWCAVAVAAAGLAGWFGARAGGLDTMHGSVTVGLLSLAALLGVLPLGRLGAQRAVAAPAFAAAAAFAVVWVPGADRLPTVVGVSGLVAAAAAEVARALDVRVGDVLGVQVVVGAGLFLVTTAGALLHAEPRAVWSVLLLAATLAARFAPAVAVDVPDQYLIDLERLAGTAWTARDRPPGRRGRMVVPPTAVAQVAARGARIVTAAAGGVWVVAAISAPLLLATATLPVDRVGARVLVGLAGAALLLAARSYRHPVARTLLRGAGLTCWAALVVVLLRLAGPALGIAYGVAGVLFAVLLVAVAIGTGRGWRSAWWSRRAEVAEALAGAGTIAALVVASGLFRALWEFRFRV